MLFSSEGKVKAGIVSFYHLLFWDEEEVWQPTLDGVGFDTISQADSLVLESPFTKEEVLGVLGSMPGDKAPGPNGFSIAFLQHCWEVVKGEVMATFEQFYHTRQFEKSLNATFLVLIPKKGGGGYSRFPAN